MGGFSTCLPFCPIALCVCIHTTTMQFCYIELLSFALLFLCDVLPDSGPRTVEYVNWALWNCSSSVLFFSALLVRVMKKVTKIILNAFTFYARALIWKEKNTGELTEVTVQLFLSTPSCQIIVLSVEWRFLTLQLGTKIHVQSPRGDLEIPSLSLSGEEYPQILRWQWGHTMAPP